MAGSNFIDFIPFILILLILILFAILPLLARGKRKKDRPAAPLRKTGETENPLEMPPSRATNEEKDLAHAGGLHMDQNQTNLDSGYRMVDAKEDLLTSSMAPAKKNGKPHPEDHSK